MITINDNSRHSAALRLLRILFLTLCGAGLAFQTYAGTYTWRGTNSTVWGDAGNWLGRQIAPTNGIYGHRLEVNNAIYNPVVYDAGQGTTIYGAAGVRGLVIGSGANGNGTMTISGGTFITTNSSAGDVLGNGDNNTGTLNINGGTFVSGSATFALGLGGGANRESNLNINSGSATMNTIAINTTRGTINFNGGTTSFSNMTAALSGVTATNNFNGGTIRARGNHLAFIPALSQANVRDGGAIIDSAGFNLTIVQPLAHSVIEGDAVTDGGLTKNGNGTLTLTGVPAYTGSTRVNAGTLVAPLPESSSALVLAAGSRFTVGVTNQPWTMTSAALTNATVDLNYGSWPLNSYSGAVMNLGNLAISGSVTCNITGTGFPVVNLTLFTYGSKTGGGSFVLGSLPPGAFAILTDDGANVVLNISSPSIQSLVWSTGDGIWKTNGSLNWNYGTATYREYPSGVNDVVTFDDSSGGGTVTIGSQVNPSATFVNVTGTPYTFVGEGSIGGTNGVALQGTASLTLCNSNNFSGPVTISGGSGSSGGTLYVSNSFALGTTAGATVVFGPANTLEIGAPGGIGIGVTNETVTISGAGVGGARGALRGAAVTSGDNVWAGPVIIAADQTRIGTEDSGNLTVAGPITDNGANLGVVFRCGANGVVTVSGSGSSYAYTRTYGDGSGTGTVRLGANNAFSTNALQLGLGQVDLNGFNQTFASITDNTGPGTVINNGAVPSTLTINTGTNSLSSFSTVGSIVDGSNVLNVIKTGKGNQTFAGPTVTYSGSTTIGGGQLTISSANPVNTAITVLAGGALGGEGTTTNSLVFQADSMLVVDPISLGSFTANMVDATAAPIKVNFTSSAPANTATLLLTAVNGFTGPASHFQSVGSRGGSFYYTNGNTQLVFVPSSVNASLSWRGNNPTNPTFWDTITTTNWSNGGAPDIFFAGDNVLFDDTASTYTVAIQGASVQPTSVTVNSTNDYSFTGVIGGNATLTKGGPGRLLLNNNNTYTGPTLITNGIINIQTSGGLGTSVTGTVISDFGTLDLGTGAALANTLNLGAEILTISGTGLNGMGAIVNNSLTADQINAVQKVVLAGNARIGGTMRWDMRGTGNALDMGAFTLTKVGDNYIALVGTAVSNPGNVVVQGGTFAIQTGADIGGSSANTLTLQGGAILNNYQTTIPQQWSLVMENNTTYQANNGSASQNIWAGPVTLNGAATLNVNAYLTINGSIAGSGSINKTGTGYATLSASNSYSGNTTVTAGTLELQQPTLAGGSTVTVAGNAVLNLTFDATNIISSLVLNGTNQPPGLYSAANAAPFLGGGGVLQVSPTAPPVLQVANLGNGQLQFSWTGNFKLQAQTNTLNIGISSNWVDYPGGAGSPVNVPVDVSRGSVFFRLISP